MNITVILCTYNRAETLSKALESVAFSELPESVEWEVLVVDNNSRDQTHDVVEEFCRRYPGRFRYLFEPQQGKSHALNSGIREARGDILAFMDDDVTVQPTWLQNLTAALHNKDWAGAGGRILPEQTFTPPHWLALKGPYAMGGVLALGPGPDENIPRFNEDTEFGRRLKSAGERLRYEPLAIVYHGVPENRRRKEYFLDWYFGFGRALVHEGGRGRDVWGIPRPYFGILKTGTTSMIELTLRWMLAVKPQQRFFYKALVWREAGRIAEMYRLASRAKEQSK